MRRRLSPGPSPPPPPAVSARPLAIRSVKLMPMEVRGMPPDACVEMPVEEPVDVDAGEPNRGPPLVCPPPLPLPCPVGEWAGDPPASALENASASVW